VAAALLTDDGARTRPFVNGPLVRRWLGDFAAARAGAPGGAISREGRAHRVFMLLSLELWLCDHGLSW
jgi:hypothetical protein